MIDDPTKTMPATDVDVAACFANPAVLATKIIAIGTPAGLRLTFGEIMPGSDAILARSSVIVPWTEVASLAQVIGAASQSVRIEVVENDQRT